MNGISTDTGSLFVIHNDAELAAAYARAEDLMGCTNGSDEERELAAIADAVAKYEESRAAIRRIVDDPAGYAAT